jgi:O-antigen/teichoic acid export membrane protein
LQPILFKKFSDNERWKNLKLIYYKYGMAMFATFILILAGTTFAYHLLLKQSYIESLHYFYLLCISSFLWTFSNIFLQYIIYTKHKKYISIIALLGITISLLVNYVACNYYNKIEILCIGQIITNFLVLGITLLFNKKGGYFV